MALGPFPEVGAQAPVVPAESFLPVVDGTPLCLDAGAPSRQSTEDSLRGAPEAMPNQNALPGQVPGLSLRFPSIPQ